MTAADVVGAFYAALLVDDDIDGATALMSPDFHLRATNTVGVNFNRDDPAEVDAATRHLAAFRPSNAPVVGPADELARHVQERCLATFPASHWHLESITISADGQTADAVTPDGSCGLCLTTDGWRMLWAWA